MAETTIYPPGPKGKFILGALPALRSQPLLFTEQITNGEYGEIIHFNVANVHAYHLTNPDHIEEVLVTNNKNFIKARLLRDTAEVFGRGLLINEGESWLRQRRLMAPAFHKGRIASYGSTMAGFTEDMLANWRDGETRDVHEDMMHVTLEIVAQTLFGAEIDKKQMEEVGRSLEIALERFVDRITIFRFLLRMPFPKNLRFNKAIAKLDEIIYGIIKTREKSDKESDDLLSMLLGARDENGGRMTELQLRDEVITLFLAGHETTAVTMSWTWYLLSLNPKVREKLEAELAEVLNGRTPTVDDVALLVYTTKVIKESMRFYPPVWRMGREAVDDFELGGYKIKKGALIVIAQWSVHRDPKFFPEPLQFNPDRWTPEMEKALPRFAYFPFGGGARKCIGDTFAMMEATLILATIAQKFRLNLVSDHPIDMWPSITLRPRFGMKMTLEKHPAQ